jgi:sec-independent protein translocase protein TatA
MGELLTPTHMIVVAVVVFVLFGGRKLPELGKGFGEGLRGFKDGINGLTDELDSSNLAPAVLGTNRRCRVVRHDRSSPA